MRVLHILKDIYPPVAAGIETHVDTIRRSMPEVTSDLLAGARSMRGSTRTGPFGSEIRVGELGRLLSVPLAPAFPVQLARLPADVVHLHMPNPPGEAAVLTSLRGRPLVVSYHADIGRQAPLLPLYRPLIRHCMNRASTIVVGSERFLETSPQLAGRAGKAEVVPYGIDVEWFDPQHVDAAEREAVRRRYGTPLIVAVGRLVYYKGFEHLIDAARDLDAGVLIVGEGKLGSELHERAAGMSHVNFTSRLSETELRTVLAAADCFVLPSTGRTESFGLATIEAQAMGVPAVVTDIGTGTIDAIEDGATGLVVPPADHRALASAIRKVLADEVRRREMAAAARRRVIERHSAKVMAERLLSVYRRATEA
jgi:rhamnosyl/mannosyltransferase